MKRVLAVVLPVILCALVVCAQQQQTANPQQPPAKDAKQTAKEEKKALELKAKEEKKALELKLKEEKKQAEMKTKGEKLAAKEQEMRDSTQPRSVVINTTVDKLKTELTRQNLAQTYAACGDEPTKISFCKPPTQKDSAYARALKLGWSGAVYRRVFTFVPSGDQVTVFAVREFSGRTASGTEERVISMDKPERDALQGFLDALKTTLEKPAASQ